MAVVDGEVTAVGPGHLGLGLAGDGANHGQAEQLGPLGDDQPHPARGGVQQDAVTGLEVMDAAHQVGRRQAPHCHGGGGLAADAVRQPDEGGGRDQALGRISA
ncbi:hypothetical protein D3C85_1041740 [compost metagenome]